MEKIGRFCPACNGLVCPYCGAPEVVHPESACPECGGLLNKGKILEGKWNIKPFKVDDYSHCLRCDKWFKTDTSKAVVIKLE